MQDARSITGLPGNPVYTCPVGKNTLRAPALVCLRTPKLPSPTCFPDRGVPHEFDPHVPPPAPGAAGRRPPPCRRTAARCRAGDQDHPGHVGLDRLRAADPGRQGRHLQEERPGGGPEDDSAKGPPPGPGLGRQDRKSTRLNSSHLVISYAVFCLKKKKKIKHKVSPRLPAVLLELS